MIRRGRESRRLIRSGLVLAVAAGVVVACVAALALVCVPALALARDEPGTGRRRDPASGSWPAGAGRRGDSASDLKRPEAGYSHVSDHIIPGNYTPTFANLIVIFDDQVRDFDRKISAKDTDS